MITPPVWTSEELERARLKAIEEFKVERLQEPLEDYLDAFDRYQGHVEELLESTVDLTLLDAEALAILGDKRLLEAFRYLAGPPVSMDDFKELADTRSVTAKSLRADPELVKRLILIIKTALDRRRFAWVVEGREPTEAERNAAVVASAALLAASRVQTKRRHEGKNAQEKHVRDTLLSVGFCEVATRSIDNLSHAPNPGEFCRESSLGGRRADVIVRLWDQRLMPIECKVSNSSVNSVKRLNNDTVSKAIGWKGDFGALQVVPTAVLSGVFKNHNLLDAQGRGVTLFWAHDLGAMTAWIAKTAVKP